MARARRRILTLTCCCRPGTFPRCFQNARHASRSPRRALWVHVRIHCVQVEGCGTHRLAQEHSVEPEAMTSASPRSMTNTSSNSSGSRVTTGTMDEASPATTMPVPSSQLASALHHTPRAQHMGCSAGVPLGCMRYGACSTVDGRSWA